MADPAKPKKKKRSSRSRFVRDAAQVLGGQLGMNLIGVISGVITARWLGPTGRGQFQLLVVVLPALISNFVKLGIPQASVYYMRRRGASASDVASNSIWFAMIMGAMAVGVCWWQRDWLLAKMVKDTPEDLVFWSLVTIPFIVLQFYLLGVAQAQERFKEYNIRQIVPNVLSLVGLTVTLVMLHMGVHGAVLVQVGIQVFMTGWMVVRMHREAPIHLRWNWPLARGMLSFGAKSYLQTLTATWHRSLDQAMVAYYLEPAAVGVYAIAVNLANLLVRIPETMGTVLFPRLAGSSDEDAHAATARVCRHTLFVTTTGAIAFAIAGPIAIRVLYGKAFEGAIVPLLISLPGLISMTLYQLLTRNFTARGRQQVNVVAACIALVSNVSLNVLLIPTWGISGAALAHVASYSAAALTLLVVFVRESGHSLGATLFLRPSEFGDLVRVARRGVRGVLQRS